MRRFFALFFLFIFVKTTPQEVATPKKMNILERHYKNFTDDIHLIKRCYLTTKHICTQKEKEEAPLAAERMAFRGIALIIVMKGIASGLGYLSRKNEPKITDELARIRQKIELSKKELKTSREIVMELAQLDQKIEFLNKDNAKFDQQYAQLMQVDIISLQKQINDTLNIRKERIENLRSQLNTTAKESSDIKDVQIQEYIEELQKKLLIIQDHIKQLEQKYVLRGYKQ